MVNKILFQSFDIYERGTQVKSNFEGRLRHYTLRLNAMLIYKNLKIRF